MNCILPSFLPLVSIIALLSGFIVSRNNHYTPEHHFWCVFFDSWNCKDLKLSTRFSHHHELHNLRIYLFRISLGTIDRNNLSCVTSLFSIVLNISLNEMQYTLKNGSWVMSISGMNIFWRLILFFKHGKLIYTFAQSENRDLAFSYGYRFKRDIIANQKTSILSRFFCSLVVVLSRRQCGVTCSKHSYVSRHTLKIEFWS